MILYENHTHNLAENPPNNCPQKADKPADYDESSYLRQGLAPR